jgi:uncharacterized membrane protein
MIDWFVKTIFLNDRNYRIFFVFCIVLIAILAIWNLGLEKTLFGYILPFSAGCAIGYAYSKFS